MTTHRSLPGFRGAIRLAATVVTLGMAASAAALDTVTFQLDYYPGGDKGLVYVARGEGYFAEEGLEVTINSGRGSSDAIIRIAAGSADVGYAGLSALMVARAEQQVPVTAIMSVYTVGPHAVVSLDGGPVKTIADLAGHTVATTPFTSTNVFFPLMLRENGVDAATVKVLKADSAALGPMLLAGRVDATLAWMTDLPKYRAQAAATGKTFNVMRLDQAGLDIYSMAVIASERFLTRRPDVARRFTRAMMKALVFCRDHPDAVGAHVTRAVPDVDLAVSNSAYVESHKLMFNEVTERYGLGRFGAERLASTWRWVAASQEFDPGLLDPVDVIDERWLPAPE